MLFQNQLLWLTHSLKESRHLLIGEGNGNPLQCYCLENPRDGGAWWAAVYGVAQSQTQLKRLSSKPKGPNMLFISLLFFFNGIIAHLTLLKQVELAVKRNSREPSSFQVSRDNGSDICCGVFYPIFLRLFLCNWFPHSLL